MHIAILAYIIYRNFKVTDSAKKFIFTWFWRCSLNLHQLTFLENELVASEVTCKTQYPLLKAENLSVKQCLQKCDKMGSKMFAIGNARDKAQKKGGSECICYGKHITTGSCQSKWKHLYQLHRIVDVAEKVSLSCLIDTCLGL